MERLRFSIGFWPVKKCPERHPIPVLPGLGAVLRRQSMTGRGIRPVATAEYAVMVPCSILLRCSKTQMSHQHIEAMYFTVIVG
jgi:hypothetical protein